MKTTVWKTVLVAGFATAMISGSARAEDEGVVRLNSSTAEPEGVVTIGGDAPVVMRGQSYSCDTGTPGLLQMLCGGKLFGGCGDDCCSLDCDDCCTVEYDDCCDSCCGDSCGWGGDGCGWGADGCGWGADGCGNGGFGKGGRLFGGRRGRHGRFGRGGYCELCGGAGCNHCRGSFLARHRAAHQARKRLNNARLNNYLHCKLGYFIHDGCGGVGCKPFGCYSIVYPDNPGHFDGRDGQVYAAQGVGGPVSVPVAPNVRHAYNYGWGIPSSRLTPISNAAY